MGKIRIGLIGAGMISQKHLRVFQENPEADLGKVIHSGFQRAKKHPQLGVFFFQAFGNLFLAPQHMEKHCQYAEKAKKYEKHC